MYWNEAIECASRDLLDSIQLRKLKATVKRMYTYVEPYRNKMQEAGVLPEDIRTLDDIRKLPFCTKEDLRDNYPYGFFAAPLDNIVRLHASSGTTGKPKVDGYTQADLDMWAECVARGLVSAGADNTSVVQIAYGYGLFTGGLGAHDGASYIGASVIPMSSGNTQKQVMMMRDFGSTHLCCTPSYALTLAEAVEKAGIKPEDLNLKGGVFGAEPWTKEMKREIEKRLGLKAYDIYGLSEIMGPGVSCSCDAEDGMHIQEDYFLAEIIDPETLEPLPDGEIGELVFTTLGKEGMPLIRYRTRDLCSITREKCSCGRTTARMSKILGRSDDMLIIRGVNVFPSQIETVIGRFEELTINYKILVGRENNKDTFEINVELAEGLAIDDIRFIENLRKRVGHELRSLLGIGCDLRFLSAGSLPRSEGKAVRIEDTRKLSDR
ncbi:MAG: phenylacetate--CoA ligase [Firmicutes bacterium]|nr:phenylacetate--CoA ligase [Bacillota bacterium]MDO4860206.1 phenylacetate--CoA ligase [Bacillota bacterium]